MKHIKDFFIETLVLTAAIIGWGILKAAKTVQNIRSENTASSEKRI